MSEFFAPGKLLLSAEYAVLQGAQAIAVPTFKGQKLQVSEIEEELIRYSAFDYQGKPWLDFILGKGEKPEELLVERIIGALAPDVSSKGIHLQSRLEFPREWGLGSSSTFISLMAKWLQKDVWPLFFEHLSGSGYDVAVAESNNCICYELVSSQKPQWHTVSIPSFFKETGLVYLGRKQNSAKEVRRFLQKDTSPALVKEISALSEKLLVLKNQSELEDWMQEHESLTSSMIGIEPIPSQILPDLKGTAKSLGAWGGDFLWFSRMEDKMAFKEAGYKQVFEFSDLVEL